MSALYFAAGAITCGCFMIQNEDREKPWFLILFAAVFLLIFAAVNPNIGR